MKLLKLYLEMGNATTDLSNTEQMVFCLHYVDDDLQVHEQVKGYTAWIQLRQKTAS